MRRLIGIRRLHRILSMSVRVRRLSRIMAVVWIRRLSRIVAGLIRVRRLSGMMAVRVMRRRVMVAMRIGIWRIMRRRIIPFLEIAAAVTMVAMSVMPGKGIQYSS